MIKKVKRKAKALTFSQKNKTYSLSFKTAIKAC